MRAPASYCGIVGMKPTHGLVPYTGAMPLIPCVDHLGPMARTVADCALLLEVIAGLKIPDLDLIGQKCARDKSDKIFLICKT